MYIFTIPLKKHIFLICWKNLQTIALQHSKYFFMHKYNNTSIKSYIYADDIVSDFLKNFDIWTRCIFMSIRKKIGDDTQRRVLLRRALAASLPYRRRRNNARWNIYCRRIGQFLIFSTIYADAFRNKIYDAIEPRDKHKSPRRFCFSIYVQHNGTSYRQSRDIDYKI